MAKQRQPREVYVLDLVTGGASMTGEATRDGHSWAFQVPHLTASGLTVRKVVKVPRRWREEHCHFCNRPSRWWWMTWLEFPGSRRVPGIYLYVCRNCAPGIGDAYVLLHIALAQCLQNDYDLCKPYRSARLGTVRHMMNSAALIQAAAVVKMREYLSAEIKDRDEAEEAEDLVGAVCAGPNSGESAEDALQGTGS